MSDLNDGFSDKTNQILEDLNALINNYMESIFTDTDVLEHGDYVNQWAIVINYGNLEKGLIPGGYLVEGYPVKMPPHSLEGLLRKGVRWVEKEDDDED